MINKNLIKNVRLEWLIPLCLLVESLIAERFIFDFSQMKFMNYAVYILAKIIIVTAGTLSVRWLKNCKCKIKQKENRKFLFVFLVIFMIFTVSILFCWPGLWLGDNHIIFLWAVRLEPYPIQSFITEMLFIISMMIIPHPVAIEFFQGLLISMIATYVIRVLYRLAKSKKVFFLLLLFVSIPSVYYGLYTMRGGMFSIVFVMIGIMFLDCICSENTEYKQIAIMSFLVGLVAAWRGESIFLFILYPFALLICIKNRKKLLMACGIMFSVVFCVRIFESYGWTTYAKNSNVRCVEKRYSLTPFITGLSRIVTQENIRSDDLERDLNHIDKIISVNDLVSYASDLAPFNYSAQIGIRDDFSDKDYYDGVKSIINLMIRNMDVYLYSKNQLFLTAVGAAVNPGWIAEPYTDEQNEAILLEENEKYRPYFQALSEDIQDKTYHIMRGNYRIVANTREVYFCIWALWIPCILLFAGSIVAFLKHHWSIFFSDLFFIAEFVMVFLLCAAESSYYFMPFYYYGWINLIFMQYGKEIENKKVSIEYK